MQVLKTDGRFATKTNAFKAESFTDWTASVINAGSITLNTDTTIQSDVELKTPESVTFAAAKTFTFKDTSDNYKNFSHTTGTTEINGNFYAKDISLKTVTGTTITVKQAEDITVSDTANLTTITIENADDITFVKAAAIGTISLENAATTTFNGTATITTFNDTLTAGTITFNANGTISDTTTFATSSLITFGDDASANDSFTFGTFRK